MRSASSSLGLSALLALPALVLGVTFDCENVRVDGQSFNLKALGGPHEIHWVHETPPTTTNTTISFDICNTLKAPKEKSRDKCQQGTRVCAINDVYRDNGDHSIEQVIPIAGEYQTSHGRGLDAKLTRLKGSQSHSDAEKEGVRVVLNGGRYPFDSRKGVNQQAIIEFICDPDRTGLEGFDSDAEKTIDARARRNEIRDDEDEEIDDGSSLKFVSYREEGDQTPTGVLRLDWRTKWACEGQTEVPSSPSGSSHWGFFTWMIIVLFLAIAAYLIFGSWLNYTRYGARGWDLVPHGDTIRDLPYSVKDWGKSLTSMVQGQGSRGGYSAV